ncbi:hypothetical protein DS2_19346 [Catenovulum agarivorans DS-2]|uniref:Uncharacterized protein n=1 Tax=Catenovulum agarivorans DS-2 TaxID=1328313 RepID=W7Q5H1_9ALTE|nr:hypothetical protein [Catenovulum agarivorans]EWH08049.1 hypothetical protein DS2_19346 [Catenovulum agarivorans DS-2]
MIYILLLLIILIWISCSIGFFKKLLMVFTKTEKDPLFTKLFSGDLDEHRNALNEIIELRDVGRLKSLSKHLKPISEASALILDSRIGHSDYFYDGRRYPHFAILKLDFVKSTEQCLCNLYTMASLYTPLKEERLGHIKVVEKTKLENGWPDYELCICCYCQQNYKAYYREHHGPWYKWEKI